MSYKKPPLGIIPKDIWEMQRLKELMEAISRYYNDIRVIPIKWIEEYNELIIKHGDKIRGDDKMNFGKAIELLKQGKKVRRKGWNGKGMYLFLIGVEGSNDYWTYINGKNDNYPLLPFIAMKTADDKVVPWLASQTDMLSEDWEVAE